MSEAQTVDWLLGAGFKLEHEPAWITRGRKPDFFATGDASLWVEVKELGPTDHSLAFDSAWNDLRKRCDDANVNGDLYVSIGSDDKKAAKSLIHYVCKESRHVRADGPSYTFVIPSDPAYGTDVRIEYESRSGEQIVLVGPAAISNQFNCYPGLEPRSWSAPGELHKSNGERITAPLCRLLNGPLDSLLAARMFHSEKALSLGASYSEVQSNTSTARIRREVTNSNKQIRNGQRFKPEPGLLVIYQETLDALGDEQLLGALFGDIAYEVLCDPVQLGEARFTKNAALTAGNNRGISAVLYLRTGGNSVFVLNPHAEYPLSWQTLAESALILEGDRFVRKAR